MFAARHEEGKQLQDEDVLKEAVASAGLDADAVAEEAWSGRPLKTLQVEHTECVEQYGVFGVPTFLEDGQAAFVRFMDRGNVEDLERMLEFLTWSSMNEFKRPRVPR